MTEPCYLGLDLGGTKIAAGVVSASGTVLAASRLPTSELRAGGDPLEALLRLGSAIVEAAGSPPLAGVGAGLPGPVDHAAIRLLAAPTIPELEGVSLTAPLEAAFGCPAAGDNDANACALGEARFGAGRGYDLVLYVTVSTGIGGGIVDRGRIFRGARGTSGEIGHMVTLPEGGPPCACGGYGCLETLASGRGIAARAREATGGRVQSAEESAAAARAGEPWAVRTWDETALYLGVGLSNAINVLDPDAIVLGGGVISGAGDLLLPRVREVVARRCMPCLARGVPIVPAELGADVGIVGAACLALESSS